MAAKKTKGKTSSKKSTNSARSRSSASRTSQRGAKAQPKRRLNPQIKAIILCAVGILLLALVIIPGGALWKTMRSFLFGVFGVCSILVPLVFIYLGIMTAKEKQMAHKGAKIALSAVIVVMVCTLVYLFGKTDFNDG